MGVVTATITSNGTVVNPEFDLLYIDITHEYNKIPSAELSYVDGDFAREKFDVSDSPFFEPGSEIEIKLKYEGASSEKAVFKGIVLKQGLQTTSDGCVLIAELSDKAVKMTSARKSAVSENKKDSDIITQLIGENGLSSGSVESTNIVHKKIVQYYVTDWDFLVSRAEVNGLFVSIKEGKISAKKPSIDGQAVMSFSFGRDEVYGFEFEADARNQYAAIESSVWDVKNQQLEAVNARDFKLQQGNLQPGKLARALGGNKDTLVSAVSLEKGEASAWADARMVRSRLSMLRGRLKVAGSAGVEVGDLIELQGMGKRFSGKTLVTAVKHQVTADGWTTNIQFGLSADWFLSTNTNVVDTKAAGLLPGVNGLQIGIVTDIIEDPDKEERVQVKIPAIDEDGSIWSRLVSIDAGSERGVAFWPEVGDEVILGFLNDDPRQPVILGSVHSSANPSPVKAADKNPEKGIVTRAGLKMLFNDEEKTIIISTSDDSMITINGKDKSIEVKDANKNSIKLSDAGISIESDNDIIIKSGAKVKIEGKAVEIKGDKVDVI